jgi:hypothetical protein
MPDQGAPISYEVLEHETPVFCVDGTLVGKVERVRADLSADVFAGLEIHTHAGARFVTAEHVVAIHERGVELDLDSGAVADLPAPDPVPPGYTADAAAHPAFLSRIAEHFRQRGGWRRSG